MLRFSDINSRTLLGYLAFTGILLVCACVPSHKERVHLETGVSVKILGPHKYEFVAMGKASVVSVDEQNVFKMKKSSCEAAKLQVTQRLDELEPNQKHRLFFWNRRLRRTSATVNIANLLIYTNFRRPRSECVSLRILLTRGDDGNLISSGRFRFIKGRVYRLI